MRARLDTALLRGSVRGRADPVGRVDTVEAAARPAAAVTPFWVAEAALGVVVHGAVKGHRAPVAPFFPTGETKMSVRPQQSWDTK